MALGRIGDVEEVLNTERKFGADASYFSVRLQMPDGSEFTALFTVAELEKARERALKNPEDVPKAEGLSDVLRDAMD